MVIDGVNQRVGIGTTTPNTLLEIGATTIGGAEYSAFTTNQSGGVSSKYSFWRTYGGGSTAFRAAYVANYNQDDANSSANDQRLVFATKSGTAEPTTKMTITGAGNVGIANTAPQSRLQINSIGSTLGLTGDAALRIAGSTLGTDQIVFGYSESGGYSPAVFGYIATTATGYQYGDLFFATRSVTTNTAPTERMRITSGGITCFAGTVCAPCFATISDYRMKSNIRPIEGLSIIMNTKPYKFEYNYDCSTSFGMIAHELQDTLPEAVFGQKDGETMQGVDYMKLLPITIKAIQEQQCTICTQASRITLLESCLGIA